MTQPEWHPPQTLHWRHNGCDSVSNHQPHDCLLNCLFRRRSKKTSKLRVTGLCGELSGDRWIPHTNGPQRGNVSIWWRHHGLRNRCWFVWPAKIFSLHYYHISSVQLCFVVTRSSITRYRLKHKYMGKKWYLDTFFPRTEPFCSILEKISHIINRFDRV